MKPSIAAKPLIRCDNGDSVARHNRRVHVRERDHGPNHVVKGVLRTSMISKIREGIDLIEDESNGIKLMVMKCSRNQQSK